MGLLVGFTGVGGGSLMTPLLVLVFGVAPQTAVGTDLLFATVTKSVGSSIHGAFGAVDWYVLRLLWLGSIPAAISTLLMLQSTEARDVLTSLLLPVLGLTLVATGAIMLTSRRVMDRLSRSSLSERLKPFQPMMTTIAGGVLGFLVTLTSVGAGAIGAVMLVYLYPTRMGGQKLVGTDIAHAIPLTLVAGLGHARLGHVDFRLLESLLLGSIPGIAAGAYLSHRAQPQLVRGAIALMLIIVGGKLLPWPNVAP